jgi:hypothetical protein
VFHALILAPLLMVGWWVEVLISCRNVEFNFISFRGSCAGEGIQCVRNMLRLTLRLRPWLEDVGMSTDNELEELRVMLARDPRWKLGTEAA